MSTWITFFFLFSLFCYHYWGGWTSRAQFRAGGWTSRSALLLLLLLWGATRKTPRLAVPVVPLPQLVVGVGLTRLTRYHENAISSCGALFYLSQKYHRAHVKPLDLYTAHEVYMVYTCLQLCYTIYIYIYYIYIALIYYIILHKTILHIVRTLNCRVSSGVIVVLVAMMVYLFQTLWNCPKPNRSALKVHFSASNEPVLYYIVLYYLLFY